MENKPDSPSKLVEQSEDQLDNKDITDVELEEHLKVAEIPGIDMTKVITYYQGKINEYKKFIKKTSETDNFRVDENSTVNFYYQILISADNKSILINKDFKNPITRIIPSMGKSESILREVLIGSKTEEVIWFFFSKTEDEQLYKEYIKKSKQIEGTQFDNTIYCKIIVNQIVYKQPELAKEVKDFDTYFNKCLDLIRYYFYQKNYKEAILLCNKSISELFSMRKELKEKISNNKKEELKIIVKKIISNKTISLMLKVNQQNKNADYEDCIKAIDNEYLKNYQDQVDDIDKKIVFRKALCLKHLKSYEGCMTVLEDLDKKYPNDVEINCLLEDVKSRITSFAALPQNKGMKKGFFKNLDFNDVEKDYVWEDEADGLNLDYVLEESEELLYKNLMKS